MNKTTFGKRHQGLMGWITEKRLLAGFTQQALSELLKRPQSFVSKYENGERNLDFIEVIEICEVLNADVVELTTLIQKL